MAPHAPRTPPRQQSQEQPSSGLVILARGEQPEIDLKVKRSHFSAHARRMDSMDEARSFIADVRSTYPDARHHCLALTSADLSDGRALAIIAPPTERSNDGGELPGMVGQSMLDVLRGTGPASTTVVVTQHLDGTLLGAGGLVRTCSETTARVLQVAARVTLTRLYLWDLRVPVAQTGRIEVGLRSRNPAATLDPMTEGGTAVSAPTIHVEETIQGPAHAVSVLATSCADPDLLYVPLTALIRGKGAAELVGSRLVEVPVSSA